MAVLTVNNLSALGADQTLVNASAGGDKFPVGESYILVIRNGGATPITATVKGKRNCSHGFLHDSAITINAGVTKMIGDLDEIRFKDTTDGLGEVTYSAVASVTVGIFKA